ncbi:MAG: polymer-forming cytoskeletal protein, partial [Chlamydiae bacterium]|nr:polymer-forming cytoskeletal protein [Chlamydiota bacterium]
MPWLVFFCLAVYSSLVGNETSLSLMQKKSDVLVVPAGSVIEGSYCRFGHAHWIAGTIEGNVYLLGSQVVVDGTIQGNLTVIGGSVLIHGRVLGNVRVLAGECMLQGEIGGDVTLATGVAQVGGVLHRELTVIAGHVKLDGRIESHVRTFTGQLEIASTAQIVGNLQYRSYNTASISPRAELEGKVIYSPSFLKDVKKLPLVRKILIGSEIATFLMNFCYTFFIGAILLRYYPHKVHRTLNTLQKHPLSSLCLGLLVVLLLPIVSVFLLISVVGAPFALTLVALNVVSFYTVKIFPILWG